MNKVIESLLERRDDLYKKLTDIDNAISSLRKICDHEWEDDGHDSHHNYEKCSICGEKQKA